MSTTENSYEGAVRRLRLMGHMPEPAHVPAFDLAGARQRARANDREQVSRMHDLETLASTACEENERLEAEVARLREDNAALQRRVEMLESTINDPRTALGLPALGAGIGSGIAAALEDPSELEPDELPTRWHWPRAIAGTAAIALVGAGLLVVAAGIVAEDASTVVTARLRAPVQATLAGTAALIDAAVARASTVHPRFGRGLVPPGWAPTLPAPEPALVAPTPPEKAAPIPAPTVAAPAPVAATAIAPKRHPAHKKVDKAPKKAAAAKPKAPKAGHTKKVRAGDKDPLGGLEL